MIRFPHAKINFGLNVVRRRDDGFHDIESILAPIPLHDILEVIVDRGLPKNEVVLTRSGLPVPGPVQNDLCWKAAMKIGMTRSLPGLRIHLHKVIPMGAGLGGGSSDGAATLMLLNDLLALSLEEHDLHRMATELGSDCPFFLVDGPQLAEGRGERLSPIALDLNGLWMMLVNPNEHVPTPEVYSNTLPTGRSFGEQWSRMDRALADLRAGAKPSLPLNVMEPYVLRTRPNVASVKERLIEAGALYASMSGSGSTVFGLFDAPPPPLEWPEGYMCWTFPT